MKQLIAAAFTLTAIVAGLVLATSLGSPAQETGSVEETTTTSTFAESDRPSRFGFGFRFSDEMPPGIGELMSCLADEGIEIPEQPDGPLMFDLGPDDIERLADALEACGLPGIDERFPFGGELPEGFLDDFPDVFPFGDDFEFHPFVIDRDELASCLAELGSFDGVDEVRERLDECLPTLAGDPRLHGSERFPGRGPRGFGFPFGGHGPFGFDLGDGAPDVDGTSS